MRIAGVAACSSWFAPLSRVFSAILEGRGVVVPRGDAGGDICGPAVMIDSDASTRRRFSDSASRAAIAPSSACAFRFALCRSKYSCDDIREDSCFEALVSGFSGSSSSIGAQTVSLS